MGEERVDAIGRSDMELLRLFGVGVFLVTCLAVGGKMLLLGRRTHRAPEITLGLSLFLSGGLGGILLFVGQSRAEDLGSLASGIRGAGLFCLSAGAIALWCFTWRVFRPQARRAAALFAVGCAAVVSGFLGEAIAGDFATDRFANVWSWVGLCGRSLAYLWAGLESLRYYQLMRRRLRLGLANRLIANRFLLWGIGALAAWGIYGVVLVNIFAGAADAVDAGVFHSTLPALITSLLGCTAGAAVGLAFFAPPAYHRWIRDGV
jgi:hypothetical protein